MSDMIAEGLPALICFFFYLCPTTTYYLCLLFTWGGSCEFMTMSTEMGNEKRSNICAIFSCGTPCLFLLEREEKKLQLEIVTDCRNRKKLEENPKEKAKHCPLVGDCGKGYSHLLKYIKYQFAVQTHINIYSCAIHYTACIQASLPIPYTKSQVLICHTKDHWWKSTFLLSTKLTLSRRDITTENWNCSLVNKRYCKCLSAIVAN